MKTKIFTASFMMLISSMAMAAGLAPDPKAALELKPGSYEVSKAQAKSEKETVCVDGAIHDAAWKGTNDDPILVIGARSLFMDFNKGLITEPELDAKAICKYSHNTSIEKDKLIHELFGNCENGTFTEKVTIKINGPVINYVRKTTFAKKGEAPRVTEAMCEMHKRP